MPNQTTQNVGNSRFLRLFMANDGLKFRDIAIAQSLLVCDFASEVGSDPFLMSRMALCGEAALNLCFGEPICLPSSLSYIFVGSGTQDELIFDRPEVIQRLESIGNEFGGQVSISNKPERSQLRVQFDRQFGRPYSVEITVNWLSRIDLGECETVRIWKPQVKGSSDAHLDKGLRVSDLELAVHTIIQALAHPTADSVFNLVLAHQLLGPLWLNPLLKKGVVWHSMELPRSLTTLTSDRFSRLTQRELDYRLGPFMRGAIAPRISSVLNDATEAIEAILQLDQSELDYLASWAQGAYRPELLFSAYPSTLASAALNISHMSRFKALQAS